MNNGPKYTYEQYIKATSTTTPGPNARAIMDYFMENPEMLDTARDTMFADNDTKTEPAIPEKAPEH